MPVITFSYVMIDNHVRILVIALRRKRNWYMSCVILPSHASMSLQLHWPPIYHGNRETLTTCTCHGCSTCKVTLTYMHRCIWNLLHSPKLICIVIIAVWISEYYIAQHYQCTSLVSVTQDATVTYTCVARTHDVSPLWDDDKAESHQKIEATSWSHLSHQ